MKQTVVIIGAGASGLAAAVMLARENAANRHIIVLEKESRVGRKILATGNGRCNLTNRHVNQSHYYSDEKRMMNGILQRFDIDQTLQFFESLGIVCMETEKGRLYPRSFQASAVLDTLREACMLLQVDIRVDARVVKIEKKKNEYDIMIENQEKLVADAVLVACGGKASPKLGSDGSGLAIMKALGFACSPVYPVMVQICTETNRIQSLKGIKFEGQASLWHKNERVASESGEILFTEYGLSGLPIFQLSICAGEYWRRNPKAALEIRLDFLPEMDSDALLMHLIMRMSYLAERDLQSYFAGLLNKRIGLAVLKAANVQPLSRKIVSMGQKELNALVDQCKAFSLLAKGNRPFDQAQVTAGGIRLNEFDANLQSKRLPGLFAAGELLDVHGDCGGYNLQWAWSSAAAAVQGLTQYLSAQK